LKTYDEVYQNVIAATNAHRRKMKKIQNAVSVSAVCITCILGVTVYMNLEKPMSVPSETEATTFTMTTEEVTAMIDTTASSPAANDTAETPSTISRRTEIPEELPETTAFYSDASINSSSVTTVKAVPAIEILHPESESETVTEEIPVHPETSVTMASASEKTSSVSSTASSATAKVTEKTSSTSKTTAKQTATETIPTETEIITTQITDLEAETTENIIEESEEAPTESEPETIQTTLEMESEETQSEIYSETECIETELSPESAIEMETEMIVTTTNPVFTETTTSTIPDGFLTPEEWQALFGETDLTSDTQTTTTTTTTTASAEITETASLIFP